MAGISLSGLASGMDWKSVVTQLMALERTPQDKAKAKVTTISNKQEAVDSIKASLLSLQTAAKGLSFGSGATQPRTVKLLGSNPYNSSIDVSTSSGAATGKFDVKVTQLATSTSLYGQKNAISPQNPADILNLTLADYGVTGGTFTINGAQYTISDTTQTIGSFLGISGTGSAEPAGINGGLVSGMLVTLDTAVPGDGSALNAPARLIFATPPDVNPSMGASGDTSNFLSALGLSFGGISGGAATYNQAIPATALGKLTLSQINRTGALSSSMPLVINGATITVSDTDTIGAIVNKINQTAAAGVTARLDPTEQRITLTNIASGEQGISFTNDTTYNNLYVALGLRSQTGDWYETEPLASPTTAAEAIGRPNGSTVFAKYGGSLPAASDGWMVRGKSMEFTLKYNGQYVQDGSGNLNLAGTAPLLKSSSNELDLSRYGFGSTILKVLPGIDPVTVGGTDISVLVSGNTSDAKSKIETFISAYNSLRTLVLDKTKVTVGSDGKVVTSVLSDQKDIANLPSVLRSNLFSAVTDASNASLSTSFDTISKIGLAFDKSGVLSIANSSTLESALNNYPTAVDALLSALGTSTTATTTQGVGTRVTNLIDRLTATSGLLPAVTSNLKSQTDRLKKQIADLDRTLAARQKSLELGFIKMEKAQSQFQSQMNALNQVFANYSTGSSK
jgi:flagellar capping protein FliD